MDAVEISQVTRTFGNVTTVDDFSLVVPQGSIYAFIGPNGSGKTTTMRTVAQQPGSGLLRAPENTHPKTFACR
ncbi:MAG: ATP-binding cassette domain-containing protein [Bryobacteraceae bacterium]